MLRNALIYSLGKLKGFKQILYLLSVFDGNGIESR